MDNEEKFLDERLNDHIDWYDKKPALLKMVQQIQIGRNFFRNTYSFHCWRIGII